MPARKTTLRAVAEDEKPVVKPPATILEAAGGSARELLVAMRNRIAKTLDEPNCPPRDQAALSRRLLEIRREIEAIDAVTEQEAAEDAEVADEPFDVSAL